MTNLDWYYIYFKDIDKYERITPLQLRELSSKMEKRVFTWNDRKVERRNIAIFNENQYRMLKGWDLNNEEDRKEVEDYFKRMKELTRNFDGDLSEYGEVVDEEMKLVKNEVLGGEIGLVLLAKELGAIHKRNDERKQGWFISADENGKTPEWNYFIQLKKAIEGYKENYTYKDEEYLKERNKRIDEIKNRIKAKFELMTNKNV